MAANTQVLGTVAVVAESAQRHQEVLGYMDLKLSSTTTANQIPYLMFPEAFQYFQIAPGTQVFNVIKRVIPSFGFLILKLRPTVGSLQMSNDGSQSSAIMRITVLEQDLATRNAAPITRPLGFGDVNTTRIPANPTFSSSTTVYQEYAAFTPGSGLVWLLCGPFNLDIRTQA